jgi:hypothetical protein
MKRRRLRAWLAMGSARCGAIGLAMSAAIGCGGGSAAGGGTFHAIGAPVLPGCFSGPFAREVEGLLPSMAPKVLVSMGEPSGLQAKLEPGCTPPFRDDVEDERVVDAGRVEAWTLSRRDGRRRLLGRGNLKVGRATLDLDVHDEANETTLRIALRGRHVTVDGKSFAPFDGEVDPDEVAPLPLPIDALAVALERCDGDTRLSRSEDGNVVRARRGGRIVWRTRWIDGGASSIVDTSAMCDEQDARLVWRGAMGLAGPLIAVASVRSDVVLTLSRQAPAQTDQSEPGSLTR